MEQLWSRIVEWYRSNAPADAFFLAAGASDPEINAVEATLGVNFPDDVRRSYRIHDGSNENAVFEFGRYLLSLQEIVRAWEILQPLAEDPQYSGLRTSYGGSIRSDLWNKRWIPLTDNGSGDHVCVDLDPTETGTVGQLIDYSHEEGPRRVLAKNFEDLLTWFAKDLEMGRFEFQPSSLSIVRIVGR